MAVVDYTPGDGLLSGIFALVAFFLLGMLPVSLYYEAMRVANETDWSPRHKLYAIGGLLPGFNAFVAGFYLFRRKRAYERAQTQEIGESSSIDVESADESRDRITERSE